MAKLHTAERVSNRDASDNFVFQRSILAYYKAAEIVSGDVLEIGTGVVMVSMLLRLRLQSLRQ